MENPRFKQPSAEEVLEKLSKKAFAESTEQKINWAVDLFCQWRFSRLARNFCQKEILEGDVDSLNISKSCLFYSLCAFLNKVKRKDGTEFPGKGLYNLIIMIQFYLEKRGFMWHLVDDPEFKNVKFTLDNLMKARCAD